MQTIADQAKARMKEIGGNLDNEVPLLTAMKSGLILAIIAGGIIFSACDAQDITLDMIAPPQGGDQYISIASWNIRYFSTGSRNDIELQAIVTILVKYDFIAIIEIHDEAVLTRTETMLQGMGRDYDYLISAPVGNVRKERYAFLFDEARVDAISAGEVVPDPNDTFLREPYHATFRAGAFDFTAIATHVIWGDSVRARRAEVQALADVYQSVQDDDPYEQDVMLLGDFNREPDDEIAYSPLLSIPSMSHIFHLPQKSHIRDSSLYDNIFFQSDYVIEYTGVSGIDRFDETHFGNDDRAASLAVSDHRPVWGVFIISQPDDD